MRQNYANVREYLDPIREMKPKLDKLKERFKNSLRDYSMDSKKHPDNVICEKGDDENIRKYQALRDCTIYNKKANLVSEYMDMVKQYGLIVLFG